MNQPVQNQQPQAPSVPMTALQKRTVQSSNAITAMKDYYTAAIEDLLQESARMQLQLGQTQKQLVDTNGKYQEARAKLVEQEAWTNKANAFYVGVEAVVQKAKEQIAVHESGPHEEGAELKDARFITGIYREAFAELAELVKNLSEDDAEE